MQAPSSTTTPTPTQPTQQVQPQPQPARDGLPDLQLVDRDAVLEVRAVPLACHRDALAADITSHAALSLLPALIGHSTPDTGKYAARPAPTTSTRPRESARSPSAPQ